MKLFRSLFFISLVVLGTTQAKHKSHHSRHRTKDQLVVALKNDTGVMLKEAEATFRFITNHDEQESIIATVKHTKIKGSVNFDSDEALFEGKQAKNHFKSSSVELIKLSAERWKIKNWKLRAARLMFKNGTTKNDFIISRGKNRFGFPIYVIKPVIQEQLLAR